MFDDFVLNHVGEEYELNSSTSKSKTHKAVTIVLSSSLKCGNLLTTETIGRFQ